MIRFYAPWSADGNMPVAGDVMALPESDSGHCVRVLRMREGDTLEVVDGAGHIYSCKIIDAHPKHAMVCILAIADLPKVWTGDITLAIAPTKHADRMEWLVEKLVEIGIDRIVPLRCRHSERKDINVERIEKIAVSAMKQSLKAVLPKIENTTSYKAFLDEFRTQTSTQRFIAYCDPSIPRFSLAQEYLPGSNVVILIGPEGDFDSDEIKNALADGWVPVTLGDNRLRTETAALVAVTTFHVLEQVKPIP